MKKEKRRKRRKRWPITFEVDGRRVSPNGVPVDDDGYEQPTPKRSPRPKIETLEVVPGHELDMADAEALYLPAMRLYLPAVRELIRRTFNGERRALETLRAVHGLLFPQKSVHVERAMEVYQLMRELSHVVTPSRVGSTTLLSGAVRLRTDEEAQTLSIYKEAKSHWKSRRTLQSLAISVYLERLHKESKYENEAIDERVIKDDLRQLRAELEQREAGKLELEIALASGETLPYVFHTEAWKQRRKIKE